MLTLTGEKLSSDEAAVSPFIEKFEKTVEDLDLTPVVPVAAREGTLRDSFAQRIRILALVKTLRTLS
ncbi:jerky-like protein [Lasius niger]|uniref:Jerky-like protein n=1 Tax=Lasius niger TaxID=67767 RepID=A0A0J7N1T4_LASNI|nr:jerky-like protein [Lasius niger]